VTTAQWAATLVALGACIGDLRVRRIPNVLTLGAAVAALAFHTIVGGLAGAIGGVLVLTWTTRQEPEPDEGDDV